MNTKEENLNLITGAYMLVLAEMRAEGKVYSPMGLIPRETALKFVSHGYLQAKGNDVFEYNELGGAEAYRDEEKRYVKLFESTDKQYQGVDRKKFPNYDKTDLAMTIAHYLDTPGVGRSVMYNHNKKYSTEYELRERATKMAESYQNLSEEDKKTIKAVMLLDKEESIRKNLIN